MHRLALIVAAASTANAQSCLWTTHQSQPPGFGRMVYHAGLHRVLFIATSSYTANSIYIWSWDGAAWSVFDSSGPYARTSPGIAYDSARDRVVMFGGGIGTNGSTSLSETWEWDGAVWTQLSVTGPSGRTAPGMEYDQNRHRTVLFGGYTNSLSTGVSYRGDTWEWDGQSWVQLSTTGPAPRSPSCFAYDSIRAKTVMYGAIPTTSTTDLWEWDGVSWLQRASNTPGPYGLWMTFDPARARMIMARYTGSLPFETWELETASAVWSLRDPGTGPFGPAAFDPARSLVVALNGTGTPSTSEFDAAGTVISPAVIAGPQSQSVTVGHPVGLAVQAVGTGIAFQWRRNGQSLVDGGAISGAMTSALSIDPVGQSDAGSYDVVLSNVCATVSSGFAQLVVVPNCYANCDNSTTPPFLNVNDFACFLNKFAAGDSYANCDGSCNPPPCLNVLDFGCFLNRFAAGCSAP